jgi:L-fucose isomerase-like protein
LRLCSPTAALLLDASQSTAPTKAELMCAHCAAPGDHPGLSFHFPPQQQRTKKDFIPNSNQSKNEKISNSSSSTVTVSRKSFELVKILDPPVSDFGTSGFVELDSAK